MQTSDISEVPTTPAGPRFVLRRQPRWSRRVPWLRHGSQALVVAWVGFALWGSAGGGEGRGSIEAFCPFGGFETAFTWFATGRTVSHVHSSNLVLAAVVVALALASRGFFCGWLCPLGSIQETLRAAGDRISRRLPALRRVRKAMMLRFPWIPTADRVLARGRYVVLAWAIVGAGLTGTMVFRAYDPWAALISVVEFEISTAMVVLALVLVLSLFLDRPFCRYACPLGAVQGLVAKISPIAIQRNGDDCLGCTICNDACPMRIPVNTRSRVTDSACIGCLECVASCPSEGALGLRVTLPLRPAPPLEPTNMNMETLR